MSRRYTEEFKAEVVRAVLDEYRLVEDVSRDFNVPVGTFGGWVANARTLRRQKAEMERAELARTKSVMVPDESTKVERLEAEILDLRAGNRILSDAVSEIQAILTKAQRDLG